VDDSFAIICLDIIPMLILLNSEKIRAAL